MRLWEVASGEMIGPPLRLEGSVKTVEYDAEGRRLFIGASSGLYVWSLPDLPANVAEMRRRTQRRLGAEFRNGQVFSMPHASWAGLEPGSDPSE